MHRTESNASDHGQARGFVLGLMCGALVGASLGLLFAPRSGSELRRQVAESANRLKRRTSEAYESASDAVRDVVDRSRHAYQAGREAYREPRREPRPSPAPVDISVS